LKNRYQNVQVPLKIPKSQKLFPNLVSLYYWRPSSSYKNKNKKIFVRKWRIWQTLLSTEGCNLWLLKIVPHQRLVDLMISLWPSFLPQLVASISSCQLVICFLQTLSLASLSVDVYVWLRCGHAWTFKNVKVLSGSISSKTFFKRK
jgi:hypothetical protein